MYRYKTDPDEVVGLRPRQRRPYSGATWPPAPAASPVAPSGPVLQQPPVAPVSTKQDVPPVAPSDVDVVQNPLASTLSEDPGDESRQEPPVAQEFQSPLTPDPWSQQPSPLPWPTRATKDTSDWLRIAEAAGPGPARGLLPLRAGTCPPPPVRPPPVCPRPMTKSSTPPVFTAQMHRRLVAQACGQDAAGGAPLQGKASCRCGQCEDSWFASGWTCPTE